MKLGSFLKVPVLTLSRKMSGPFTVRINPLIAKKEWVAQPHVYDFYQEIARSCYADMLHDTDRNEKYFIALAQAIQRTQNAGKRARVLDIGTGTGILSMMAAFCGADEVTGCEVFAPVAQCASAVLKRNSLEDKIKIIKKRSTDLKVGKGQDLEERANILVAEVFDTELIGEGALLTFQHALQHLMEPNSIVIPSSAIVYGQAIDSDVISKWNKITTLKFDGDKEIIAPVNIASCAGNASIHDVQMSQIPDDCYRFITKPIPLFEFDFTGRTEIQLKGISVKETEALLAGKCDAVFMWWVLNMDEERENVINNGPKWVQYMPNKTQWRDHWMQGVYFLPKPVHVTEKQKLALIGNHDEYSMWFRIHSDFLDVTIEKLQQTQLFNPGCTCMAHLTDSRSRLAMKFDTERMNKYIGMLKKTITPHSVCLCIGDGSLLSLVAAKLGAKKVFAVEPESPHQLVTKCFINANELHDVIRMITKEPVDLVLNDLGGMKVDVLIAEPYFTNCVHPWDLVSLLHLRKVLQPLLSPDAVVIPELATVKGVVVDFENLWKIRAPVKTIMGYDLGDFDRLIQRAIQETDAAVEPHQLWEYPGKAISKEFDVLTFDFSKPLSTCNIWASNVVHVQGRGTCNGVALWVDYSFKNMIISSGPLKPTQIGTHIEWPMNCTQAVNFVKPVHLLNTEIQQMKYFVAINMRNGEMSFRFHTESL